MIYYDVLRPLLVMASLFASYDYYYHHYYYYYYYYCYDGCFHW